MIIKDALLNGRPVNNIHNIYSEKELNSLKEEQYVKILSTNPKQFGDNDKVSLKIKSKNVKQIKVCIYELDSFVVASQQAQIENMNFDGIKANHCFEIDINNKDDEMLETTQFVDINYISERKKGYFILDMFAGNLKSRAYIKRGGFSLLRVPHAAGQLVQVIDHNQAIVKSSEEAKLTLRLGTVEL